MTVISNPLLLKKKAAAAADDSYKIERSLVLNRPDQAHLTNTPGANGDRRTWTISYWFKIGKVPTVSTHSTNHHTISDNYDIIGLMNTSEMGMFHAANGIGSKTVEKLRDVGAWYHLVYVLDTTNSIDVERCRMYCNGVRMTNATPGWGNNRYPNRYEEMQWNRDVTSYIGVYPATPSYEDCTIADLHFISGQALGPAAFGEFDSNGIWNPKEFAVPAPNDGTTWSGKISAKSGSFHSSHPATYAFNGNLGNKAGENSNGADNGLVFNPDDAFEGVSTLRFYGESVGANMKFRIHDGTSWGAYHKDNDSIWNGSNTAWRDISAFIPTNRKVKQLEYESEAGGHAFIGAIEVNGVMLVDDQIDHTTRNNPNDYRVFSDGISGGAWGGYPVTDAFNGALNNGHIPPSGGTSTITFSPAITVDKKVEFYIQFDGSYGDIKVNGTAIQSQLEYNSWCPITGITWPLSTIEYSAPSGSAYVTMRAIRVDGHVLLDSSIDNSFHLKLDDPGNIGKNSFVNKLAGFSNGMPFYNTNGSGTEKSDPVGYRSDSSAGNTDGSGLVLALPGDVMTDEHDHVNTNSSAKTMNADTKVYVSAADSRYYGKSLYFNGKDSKLTTTTDASDFDISGGTFTFECWFMPGTSTSTSKTIFTNKETGDNSQIALGINTNKLFAYTGSSQIMTTTQSTATGNGMLQTGRWHHIAVTRDGTSWRWFVDGLLLHTSTSSVSGSDDGAYFGYGSAAGGSPSTRYIEANYNDIRFYKGVCKYNAAFKVPQTSDWFSHNLTPGDTVNYSGGGSGSTNSGQGFDKMFNSNVSDGNIVGSSGAWDAELTVTFSPAITVNTDVEVLVGSGVSQYKINSGSYATKTHETGKWHSLGFTGTLTTLTIKGNQSSNHAARCAGVRVDGNVLTDSNLSDSSTDSPSEYGTDTGKGGEIRSNYCTINSLDTELSMHTLTEGNLKIAGDTTAASGTNARWNGTFGASSGKWYYEVYIDSGNTNQNIGISYENSATGTTMGNLGGDYQYTANGQKRNNNSSSSFGDAWDTGDYIGVAYDLDANKIWFSVDGSWQASGNPAGGSNECFALTADKIYRPAGRFYSSTGSFNFGQRAFKYAAPSGFKCLCSFNLPDAISDPSKYFDAIAYTGDGTGGGTGGSWTANRILPLKFRPEFGWIKSRTETSQNDGHVLVDVVRTAGNVLQSSDDGAADDHGTSGMSIDFHDTGLGVAGTNNGYSVNVNNETYAAWAWDAGTATSGANNAGTINIASGDQWVNNTAGFSITKYTGTGSDTDFGHGLTGVPEWIIIKKYSTSGNWTCQHVGATLGSGRMILDEDYANDTSNADTYWNSTAPTASKIYIGDHANTNGSGATHICYAWTPIVGYSAFGKYTGNASAIGPFIYTGFLPKYLIIKRLNGVKGWMVIDTSRNPSNVVQGTLYPHDDAEEHTGTGHRVDLLSNGFKIMDDNDRHNASGGEYLYCAFAESPLKTARAR